jgi:hypothetical protein
MTVKLTGRIVVRLAVLRIFGKSAPIVVAFTPPEGSK